MALSRFRRNLKSARLSVRQLTHTLHLPSTHSELYDAPDPAWFGQLHESVPNLQSLIVSGLSFFDHQALYALRSDLVTSTYSNHLSSRHYPLKLLEASSCPNITAKSLGKALTCFTNLIYLDLSGFAGVRDDVVLFRLQAMPDLQVLKLQRCNLRDSDIAGLMVAIGSRVRSLDLTGNALSNYSAYRLLLSGIVHETSHDSSGMNQDPHSTALVEEWTGWPLNAARPDPAVLDEFRDECLNMRFMQRLTSRPLTQIPSQNMPHCGITHLYISENHLDARGVLLMLESLKLHVLDAGRLSISKFHKVEDLIPALESNAKELTYLRLHHSVVTGEAPFVKDQDADSNPTTEGTGGVAQSESEIMPPAFEVAIDEPAPQYELQGASTLPVVPTTQNRSASSASQTLTGCPEQPAEHGEKGPFIADSLQAGRATHDQGELGNRPKRMSRRHGLLPHMVPSLRTLVLTEVPSHEKSALESPVSESLIYFIQACAHEVEMSRRHNLLEPRPSSQTNRAQPQSRHSPSFALKRIVLELEAPNHDTDILDDADLPLTALQPPETSAQRTLSSTEDVDSENLWAAAKNDYSFFGDEEKVKPGPHSRMRSASTREQEAVVAQARSRAQQQPQPDVHSNTTKRPQKPPRGKDMVQEIAKFRKERKVAFERGRAEGRLYTEGHWDGEVKVVRHVD